MLRYLLIDSLLEVSEVVMRRRLGALLGLSDEFRRRRGGLFFGLELYIGTVNSSSARIYVMTASYLI